MANIHVIILVPHTWYKPVCTRPVSTIKPAYYQVCTASGMYHHDVCTGAAYKYVLNTLFLYCGSRFQMTRPEGQAGPPGVAGPSSRYPPGPRVLASSGRMGPGGPPRALASAPGPGRHVWRGVDSDSDLKFEFDGWTLRTRTDDRDLLEVGGGTRRPLPAGPGPVQPRSESEGGRQPELEQGIVSL